LSSHAGQSLAREQAMPEQLSPFQRQIARALWGGADLSELSRRFSRSIYRIERQIETVYAAFGVSSRNALLDAARSRGLA
jgi:DNA-binding NarL/FixJ family response regulator